MPWKRRRGQLLARLLDSAPAVWSAGSGGQQVIRADTKKGDWAGDISEREIVITRSMESNAAGAALALRKPS